MDDNWTLVMLNESTTLGEMLDIIDDALVHGFRFMVKNHALYCTQDADPYEKFFDFA